MAAALCGLNGTGNWKWRKAGRKGRAKMQRGTGDNCDW
jgi:hypothetical protein